MQDETPPLFRRSGVWTTLNAALAVAFLSFAATEFLARGGVDRVGLAQLAGGASRDARDPVTTGSLASVANLRLDPCAIEPRR